MWWVVFGFQFFNCSLCRLAQQYFYGVSEKAIAETGRCSDGSCFNESFLNDSQFVRQFDDILSAPTHGDCVVSSQQAHEATTSDELRSAHDVLVDALNVVFPGMCKNAKAAFLKSKLRHC